MLLPWCLVGCVPEPIGWFEHFLNLRSRWHPGKALEWLEKGGNKISGLQPCRSSVGSISPSAPSLASRSQWQVILRDILVRNYSDWFLTVKSSETCVFRMKDFNGSLSVFNSPLAGNLWHLLRLTGLQTSKNHLLRACAKSYPISPSTPDSWSSELN